MHEMKRTATCGQLTAAEAGQQVTLNGWVARIRDHGGITFVDLRDRYGVTQVVFDLGTADGGTTASRAADDSTANDPAVRADPSEASDTPTDTDTPTAGDPSAAGDPHAAVASAPTAGASPAAADGPRATADTPAPGDTPTDGASPTAADGPRAADAPATSDTPTAAAPAGAAEDPSAAATPAGAVRDPGAPTSAGGAIPDPDALAAAVRDLKLEYCIAVRGSVRRRPPAMVNRDLATGEIEVTGDQLQVLSTCATLPFMVHDQPGAHTEAREELRLKHRYLDLRSATMQRNLALRHRAAQALRAALNERQFLEIETPTLMRSTPEGARDFVVPSRLKPGSFYALPQSPQILKQLLMLSGYDRYYQLARCYRDEDARGDRQPEFTQLDFEMSFVDQEEVLAVLETAFAAAFREGIGYELPLPFTRITFEQAMNRYGSDRPDLRYGLELQEFTALARAGEFGIFRQAAERGDTVKALRAPGLAGYSRRQIEELEGHAKTYGAAGLAWLKCGAAGLESGVSRFYQGQQADICSGLGVADGDLLLLVAAPWRTACTALGAVRTELARREGLADANTFHPCFVTDFPLFAWNEEEGRWEAEHHMFSLPQAQYLERLEQDPGAVRGELYDAVINGLEVASGSIRIHDPALQRRVFAILGVSEEQAAERFGFMLDAFRYGAPPHGGAAIGFDRTVMLMAGEAIIRDVIAFPKNTWAASPMDDSPAPLDAGQLRELHLQLRPPAL